MLAKSSLLLHSVSYKKITSVERKWNTKSSSTSDRTYLLGFVFRARVRHQGRIPLRTDQRVQRLERARPHEVVLHAELFEPQNLFVGFPASVRDDTSISTDRMEKAAEPDSAVRTWKQ